MTFSVNSPTIEKPNSNQITQNDLFGKNHPIGERGKYVFAVSGEPMGVYHGTTPFKARIVIVPIENFDEAKYWLEYVYGGDCITKWDRVQIDKSYNKVSELEVSDLSDQSNNGNHIVILAEYQCW